LTALATGFANYVFIGTGIIKACVKVGFPPNLKQISGQLSVLLVGISKKYNFLSSSKANAHVQKDHLF